MSPSLRACAQPLAFPCCASSNLQLFSPRPLHSVLCSWTTASALSLLAVTSCPTRSLALPRPGLRVLPGPSECVRISISFFFFNIPNGSWDAKRDHGPDSCEQNRHMTHAVKILCMTEKGNKTKAGVPVGRDVTINDSLGAPSSPQRADPRRQL